MATRRPPKREYGSGGISWLTASKVRLRVWAETPDGKVRRTKVVKVAHRDHGGRGEAADELEAFAKSIESETAQGPDARRTVKELLEIYVAHCKETGRAQSTTESYEDAIKRLPDAILGVTLGNLTTYDLDRAYGAMSDRGLSANTVLLTHSMVRAALTQAVTWKWVPANEASAVKLAKRKKTKFPPLPLADVYRMIVAADTPKDGEEDGETVVAMGLVMAALTGCRRGELCGLRWDDIDTETGWVTIERQWVPARGGGQYLKTPKSEEGIRRVNLDTLGLALIERYRDSMRDLLQREPEGWLLSHDAGTTPMRSKALGLAITKLGRDLGLKVTTHSFRRVSATELVAAGVDVDTAARRMGHTKEVMLSTYVLGADDKSLAAGKIIEDRFVAQGLPLGEIFQRPKKALPT